MKKNNQQKNPVVFTDIESSYKAMAADEDREREAMEWIEGTLEDFGDEKDWVFDTASKSKNQKKT